MNPTDARAAIATYNMHIAVLSEFETAYNEQVEHLESLRQSEIAKIGELTSQSRAFANQSFQAIQAAVQGLNSDQVRVEVQHIEPEGLTEGITVNQIAEKLSETTNSAVNQSVLLPRLHKRHSGMQRDIIIVPLVVLICLFATVSTVSSDSSFAATLAALMGAGAAALVVKLSGGGWTFRRLGGQDYTPRRRGQKAGTGALAAFLTCLGISFLVWGLFTPPSGLIVGLLVGGGLLIRPALRARQVVTIDEQEPK